MIANVPYIETFGYKYKSFNTPVVDESVRCTSDDEGDLKERISFLNAYKSLRHVSSTEEIINRERRVDRRIKDITTVRSFLEKHPEVFAFSSEQFVLAAFEKMRNGLMQLSLDSYYTGISSDEGCLFIYGRKGGVKLFFNLFFEKNEVETLVNISMPGGKYIIEDNIENSVQQLFEILQTESFYAELS